MCGEGSGGVWCVVRAVVVCGEGSVVCEEDIVMQCGSSRVMIYSVA